MQGKALMLVGWLATVGGAWFLGSQGGPEAAESMSVDAQVLTLQGEVADLRARLEARGPVLEALPPIDGGGRALTAPAGSGASGTSVTAVRAKAPYKPVHEIDITGMTKPEEIVAHFIAYAQTMLAKGREGHLELLSFLGNIEDNKELGKQVQAIFEPMQERAVVYAYDGLKFAMEHDREVLALTETLFEQMAENPSWFEGMDDDPFELFTEGLGMLAPAVATPEQMKRLRSYAQTIVATETDTMPKAIERNRRDIQRLLQVWAPQLTVDEILAKIKQGSLSDQEIASYLHLLPPEALALVDVGRVLGPSIAAGDYRSMRMLRNIDLDAHAVGQLDEQMLAAAGSESGRINAWTIRQYLESTKRTEWPQAQGFFEQGLARGGKTTETMAQALMQVKNRPSADWVRDALGRYTISDGMVMQMKSRWKLE